MTVIFKILACTLLLWLIYEQQQRLDRSLKNYYYVSAVVKLLFGLGLGWVYTYYYDGGDTFYFFELAERLHQENSFEEVLFQSDLFVGFKHNRDVFFTRIIYLIGFLFGFSYWIISAAISLFSLLTIWFFIIQVNKTFPQLTVATVLAMTWIPSTLFWTSGLMKESIVFIGILLLTSSTLQLISGKRSWLALVVFVLASLILLKLKYYILAIWGPAMLFYLIYEKLKLAAKTLTLKLIFLMVALLLFIGFVSVLHINTSPGYILQAIAENHDAMFARTSEHNRIDFGRVEPDFGTYLLDAPKAIFYGLFGPLLRFEVFAQGLNSLENIGFLLLFIVSLFKLKRSYFMHIEVWIVIFVVLSLALFMTLSTPSLGTLVRYSTAYKPFVWLLGFALLAPPKGLIS